ncbi:ethanolamine utilization protein EutD [mine drainage metagenome]|uniref:phosphate acetyltransferase n=1 Tax=mine drainage metagenome TaxID=410659 RepID=A0A1J5PE42_9ZZZZ
MSKKNVIVANDVRDCAASGATHMYRGPQGSLITPEALDIARELGIELRDGQAPAVIVESPLPPCSAAELDAIRDCVLEAVRDRNLNASDIAQVVRRVAQDYLGRDEAPCAKKKRNNTMNLNPWMQRCAQQIVQSNQHNCARIVFPDALDERTLQAATELAEHGWAKPVLVTSPAALLQFCQKTARAVPQVSVVDPSDTSNQQRWAQVLQRLKPAYSSHEAQAMAAQPLYAAALMLSAGEADYCIAGNVSSTADVLRAGLRGIGLAQGVKTLSSVFFMLSPQADRVLVFGDCGVVPEPTAQQLADIALCAADNFKNVTAQTPRVALLSFSTRGSAKHASIDTVREALKLIGERRPDLAVDGEMQFDAAFVPEVGQRKAPGSQVAGQANVYIFPNLAAGNVGYMLAERLGGYTALGPMIQGLRQPMHDLSRGCSAEDMVQTALLAMRMHPLQS